MIEQGFVKLVQVGIASTFTPAVPGGYGAELPKDTISATQPKAWVWKTIIRTPTNVLAGRVSYAVWCVQVDCHGFTAADAVDLSYAIDSVLRAGFAGVLNDSAHTIVDSIWKEPRELDGFDDTNRTFVHTLEYRIQYYQS